MDISSKGGYPSNKLSNFAGHQFTLDGWTCNSMEGFLQSLKFEKVAIQREVCLLIGLSAKRRGSKKNWQERQVLWWQGKPYHRSGQEYQDLLDRAYMALFQQSDGFRRALLAAGKDSVFTHSMGRNKENETVLTTREFCSRLNKLKDGLFNE